jgi:cell wall assembly regulator SMI1/ankyrin repeat protein
MPDTTTFKLRQAIAFNRVDEIQQLLTEPGLVNKLDEDGEYPLTNAAGGGHPEVVKILLDAGAEINRAEPESGDTPLMKAAWSVSDRGWPGDVEVVKLLISAGADVHAKDNKARTALHDAVGDRRKANLEVVKALIAAGADVNAVGKVATVLMLASRNGSPEMVKALIVAGAEVNATTWFGTALIRAADENRADNVAVLLENGANADFRLPADLENEDFAGKTALDVARDKKAKKVIALLEAAESQKGKPGASIKKPAKAEKVSVAACWKKIDAWLKANNPDLKKSLNKPASDQQIADLEKVIGARLPADFKESLKIHNGQKYSEGDLIPPPEERDSAYFLMASGDIAEEWQNRKKLHDSGEFADKESGPDKGIQDAWWHPGWIPFASNGGGDSFCLDLAPSKEGQTGQVITMNHESAKREMLAPSFAQWLADLAEAIERGELQEK